MATSPTLPPVNVSEHGKVRYLHLGTAWVQGSMWVKKPFDIELEYVQRMQAWLLFHQADAVADLHAMQLGLGAASLTKHCHRVLGMRTTAIELNPHVVAACRTWFELPLDDDRLSVVLGDAAEVAAHEHWQGQIDVLHVDLYDDQAAAPVLDDPVFYGHCKNLLTPRGCLVVNLFGRSSRCDRSVAHMAQSFGHDAMWAFHPTREGNTVVMALHTASHPSPETLHERASHIQSRWRLSATQWLRHLKPLSA